MKCWHFHFFICDLKRSNLFVFCNFVINKEITTKPIHHLGTFLFTLVFMEMGKYQYWDLWNGERESWISVWAFWVGQKGFGYELTPFWRAILQISVYMKKGKLKYQYWDLWQAGHEKIKQSYDLCIGHFNSIWFISGVGVSVTCEGDGGVLQFACLVALHSWRDPFTIFEIFLGLLYHLKRKKGKK